jgi:hypothetical protein
MKLFMQAIAGWAWRFHPAGVLSLTLAACSPGAGAPPAVPKPPVEEEPPSPPPPAPKPSAAEAAPAPSAVETAAPASSPPPDPSPEPCDAGWTCVKVVLDAKTIEKRPTRLIGDPKIGQTWSKWSDGRVVTFEDFSQGPLDFMLRRKPNDKNEVVVKTPAGAEIVVDRHDGTIDDFTHVDLIAAEEHGALLVDFRYSKF